MSWAAAAAFLICAFVSFFLSCVVGYVALQEKLEATENSLMTQLDEKDRLVEALQTDLEKANDALTNNSRGVHSFSELNGALNNSIAIL